MSGVASHPRRWAVLAALALAACDDPIPEFEPVPEPEQALRPVAQRGTIPE